MCIFNSCSIGAWQGNYKAGNRYTIYASCSLRNDHSITEIPSFFHYGEVAHRTAYSFGATKSICYNSAEPRVDTHVINKYPTWFPMGKAMPSIPKTYGHHCDSFFLLFSFPLFLLLLLDVLSSVQKINHQGGSEEHTSGILLWNNVVISQFCPET